MRERLALSRPRRPRQGRQGRGGRSGPSWTGRSATPAGSAPSTARTGSSTRNSISTLITARGCGICANECRRKPSLWFGRNADLPLLAEGTLADILQVEPVEVRVAAVSAPGCKVVAPNHEVVRSFNPTFCTVPGFKGPDIVTSKSRADTNHLRVLKPWNEDPVDPQFEQITCACAETAFMIWSASSPQW